ncbi:MAG: tRNA 2-thiouridine(34) synthase MnmA [Candidatus Eisenbacteria bacterium]|nr:tRNA 2-thiouridine(34) synthase MnmA [Candidatus Eisenbacteria bacterium]
MKKSILVAMSGGVDSSVAACLLSRTAKVIGITMKLWCFGEKPPGELACCSEESIEDAREVARKLGIRHYVIDLEPEFEKEVVERFVRQYLRGLTPNPCVLCNSFVRFSSLLRKAGSLGVDSIATGHYAGLRYDPRAGRHQLLRAKDRNKDQSYFLWGLKQNVLAKCLFPLGELTKDEVRKLAREARLPVAGKKESQDICFAENGEYGEFLKRKLGRRIRQGEEGPIFSEKGKRIGTHKGVVFYTIGQRKGLGIAAPRPLYVTKIDAAKNALYVGQEEELQKISLLADGLNLVSAASIGPEARVLARIRYRHLPARALLVPTGTRKVKVTFEKPQRAITPGQSVVFYEGDAVLGGATIVSSA